MTHRDPDCERADWLNAATIRLGQLATGGREDFERYRLALFILRGIEAEGIPCPIVRRSRAGSINILWSHGPVSLEIAIVSPTCYRTLFFRPPNGTDGPHTYNGGHVDPIRDALREVFPFINSAIEQQLNSLCEVHR